MLIASMLTTYVVMMFYMLHSCQFRALVMSPLFHPYELFKDITLDDVHPPCHPLRYSTNREFDSNTWLTLTISMESYPSESSYPTYFVGSYHSEPSQPSVIFLFSDSSASSVGIALPSVHGRGFIRTCTVPRGRGREREGGCGYDAPGGFRNRYILLDG